MCHSFFVMMTSGRKKDPVSKNGSQQVNHFLSVMRTKKSRLAI